MRKVSLFIAMSLDGYIADSRGGVNWLEGYEDGGEAFDSYSEFIKEIDTVVMGWNTYDQIVTELSPEEWVYEGLTSYVLTHRRMESSEKIRFTDRNAKELIAELKTKPGKGIWICGGASVAGQLIAEDLIDRYEITVVPTLLGSGIRLFGHGEKEIKLKLIRTRSYQGMTDLIYERRTEKKID